MNIILVYVTCKSPRQAEDIAEKLLKKRLAACINIIQNVTSMYLWPPKKDTTESAKETLLIIKTLEHKWGQLEKTITAMHIYKTPEIIAVPLSLVNKPYADWLTGELT